MTVEEANLLLCQAREISKKFHNCPDSFYWFDVVIHNSISYKLILF